VTPGVRRIFRNPGWAAIDALPCRPSLDLPPTDELVDDLGLKLERTFTIRQLRVAEDCLMFEVQIDGKQTSLRLGVEREQMLLQCLMEIADAECEE